MSNMEFLKQNLYNTTSMVYVPDGTDTTEFLFDNGTRMQYESTGFISDTAYDIYITLPTNSVVSHVLVRNHNIKTAYVLVNSVTTVASITQNSATSSYLSFSSVTTSTIRIQVQNTITDATQIRIGEIWITERALKFDQNPANTGYDPVLSRKQIIHEMPDGGMVSYNIKEKFQTKMKWKFADSTFRNTLMSIYLQSKPIIFVPFPTTSAWDGDAYECIWRNKWDFTYSSNIKTTGWEGSIDLVETPGG